MPITQTSRTILFEKFSNTDNIQLNGEDVKALNLMLSSGDEVERKKIIDALTVRSYEEFLEKFPPVFYEKMMNEEGSNDVEGLDFRYSFENMGNGSVRKNIVDQSYYKMALLTYQRKGTSGSDNLSYDYTADKEIMSPEAAVREAKLIRSELEYNIKEYCKLVDKGASKYEKSKYIDNVNKMRAKIQDNYYSQSCLGLIPLAIADINRKIENSGSSEIRTGTPGMTVEGAEPLRITACEAYFDKDGDINFKKAENNVSGDVKRIGTDYSTKLLAIVENDFDKSEVNHLKNSEFGKHLIISSFTSSGASEEAMLPVPVLEERKHKYEVIYKKSQENFVQEMTGIVEKLLNVRAFFDHAAPGTELIVANCHIADLIYGDKKSLFENFIKMFGKENNDKKIWFAVIPALESRNPAVYDSSNDFDIDDDFIDINIMRRNGGENKKKSSEDPSTFSDVKNIMSLMKESGIITFYNYKANEKTGFAGLDNDVLNFYKKEFEGLTSDERRFSVLCYPNFTILPRAKSDIELIDGIKIESPGIYIDSSYIACGMICASQSCKYLEKLGFDVKEELGQPVRFDFEDKVKNKSGSEVKCYFVITSKMNRETYNSDKDLKEELKRNGGFGFCFTGDYATINGEALKYSYVLSARTLAMDEVYVSAEETAKNYRPIYKTLTKTYLEASGNAEKGNFGGVVDSWNVKGNRKYINNPVYDREYKKDGSKERIDYVDSNNITVVFGGKEENLNMSVGEVN